MPGSIIELDPTKVRLGTNVRRIDKLDPDFVASISDVGVLQPPTIVLVDDVYEVIIGQRRTLAAIEAGLISVPFYLVPAHEADAARILDQITENEQREKLTNAERAGGYQQLALIGWSPEDIVERTRAPRKTVDAALALAGHDQVTAAVVEHEIDLEQAAQMIEFEGNAKATAVLLTTAQHNPDRFQYVLREEQRKAALAASKKELTQKLKDDGTARAKPADFPYYSNNKTGARLENLRDTKDKGLTPANHKLCPGHAAFIEGGAYDSKAKIIYVCTDWAANGHKKPGHTASKTPTKAEIAKREADEKAAAERQAAQEISRDLRIKFLQDLLQRNNKITTLPGADKLLAHSLLGPIIDRRYYDRYFGVSITAELLHLELPADGKYDYEQITNYLTNPKQHATAALAGALGMFEASARLKTDQDHKTYFDALIAWGHNLTEYEKASIESRDEELARIAALVEKERLAAAAAASKPEPEAADPDPREDMWTEADKAEQAGTDDE